MELNFGWLLNKRSLALRQIVPPSAPGFTVVQPSELEDASEFIQPHALVLTVGIAFRDREPELGRYIDHLADAGAVAVGFGTGLTFSSVPPIVEQTARRRGIGLFEVPRRIPFISIVTAAHQEQRRRAYAEQQKLFDAQEHLTHTATAGSLDLLLEAAAEHLEARVSISTAQDTVVGKASSPRAVEREKAGERLHYSSYRMSDRAGRHHVIEVHSVDPLTAETRSLVRHCAGLADMLLARPTELRAARNDLNSFALSLRLGLGADSALLPAVFDSPTDEDGFTRPIVIAADNPRSLDRARAALDAAAEADGHFLYAAAVDHTTLLLLVRADQPVDEVLGAFGSAGRRVRVAVGRCVAAADLTAPHVEALKTRAGLLAPGEHSLPEAVHVPWLAEPAVATALAARHTELFGRLRREDELHGTDYARTLTVFVRHGGQLTHTAEALGIHRHTARNRMARIQDICEIDLSDPATFAETFFSSLVKPEA
ncbi:PucR family transcriptional regulator [Corynebacterium sp. UBA2622]|uniref:PucR family transcriptional regulator n=1 Tax=Corynebacterium sp. UBA2622 TaxID=1946393 RepID=UPI0025B93981|nr:PucR family transcriptional regulator [Corynebacterium sp. UBA2622]